MEDFQLNNVPESCKLDAYELTNAFSELLYLADLSSSSNNILGESLLQKKSDEKWKNTNMHRGYSTLIEDNIDTIQQHEKFRYKLSA